MNLKGVKMKLKQFDEYVSKHSDLKVTILKVYFTGCNYSKVKISLSNKNNDILYEVKTHKLFHKNVIDKDWRLCE